VPQLTGGHIAAITPNSIAARLGWQPGDCLLSLNGHALRDVLDYRFYQAEDQVEAVLLRDGERLTYRLTKHPDEDLGLEFTEALFDGLRTCRNNCPFCFLRQNPRGLRRSLYVKDDDYRLSFLFGDFVTLTNLQESDWQRLAEQHLSPLRVSVHATDLALRRRLLGRLDAPDVRAQIQRLGSLGLQVHTQIVVCPGLNDGPALAQTVHDLAECYPVVQSIAIVPVGLTEHVGAISDAPSTLALRPPTVAEAQTVVRQGRAWQRQYRQQLGLGLVYLADEWLLLAGQPRYFATGTGMYRGQPVPSARYYDAYPQLENGVGLVRLLLDDWARVKGAWEQGSRGAGEQGSKGAPLHHRTSAPPHRCATLVCGTLIAPTMQRLVGEWQALAPGPSATLRLVAVPNRFFGHSVTVSGLLTAQDVLATLRGHDPSTSSGHRLGDLVFLPRVMFDARGERTLDDATLADIERELGVPVALARTMREVKSVIASAAKQSPSWWNEEIASSLRSSQ
jgi:putative radical SAM enzyme (TIGR03279 family)